VLNVFLALLVYLLLVVLFALKKKLKLQKKETKELWDIQDTFFKSLYTVIKSDPSFKESQHKLFLVEVNHKIRNTNDYVYVHSVGKNIYNEPSNFIKLRISGDSPVDDVKILGLKAKDKKSGIDLYAEPMKEFETLHFKPYKIYFKDPLPKNGDFDIEITYKWPGEFTKLSNYVGYVLEPRITEIDNFKSQIIFDMDIDLIRLYKIQQTTDKLLPQILLEPLKRKGKKISFEIKKPAGFYFLQWTSRI
jgi:hypothetical protein